MTSLSREMQQASVSSCSLPSEVPNMRAIFYNYRPWGGHGGKGSIMKLYVKFLIDIFKTQHTHSFNIEGEINDF